MPKEDKIKYGLWEDGKRTKWFNEQEVRAVSEGADYTSMFQQQDSAMMVSQDATFSKPYDFNDKLDDLKKRVALLHFKRGSSSAQKGASPDRAAPTQ